MQFSLELKVTIWFEEMSFWFKEFLATAGSPPWDLRSGRTRRATALWGVTHPLTRVTTGHRTEQISTHAHERRMCARSGGCADARTPLPC